MKPEPPPSARRLRSSRVARGAVAASLPLILEVAQAADTAPARRLAYWSARAGVRRRLRSCIPLVLAPIAADLRTARGFDPQSEAARRVCGSSCAPAPGESLVNGW